MIRIVFWVIDVGVVLQSAPREHRVTKAQQQRSAAAHHRIQKRLGMGRVMAGIVNHGALEMQSQKPISTSKAEATGPQTNPKW